ncbi:MAG TPA: cytochrome c [Candidatus Baltobacteraceae bacterium]|jgi:mono/diheme cytochrome c family protein
MARGILIGIILTLGVLALGGYAAVNAGWLPANADARPGKLETWAAKTSLRATINRETAGLTSPLQPTAENLAAGVKLYAGNCAVCHGVASGPGTNIARGFYQFAPQFGRHGVTDDPIEETYWKITHGIRLTPMPAYSHTLDDTARWQVALFLKHQDELPPAVEKAWKAMKITEALAPPLPVRPPDRPGAQAPEK